MKNNRTFQGCSLLVKVGSREGRAEHGGLICSLKVLSTQASAPLITTKLRFTLPISHATFPHLLRNMLLKYQIALPEH